MSDIDRQLKEQRAAFATAQQLRRKESIAAFTTLRSKPTVDHPVLGKRPPWWRVFARRAWDRKRAELHKPVVETIEQSIGVAVEQRRVRGEPLPTFAKVSPETFWEMTRRLNAKVGFEHGVEFVELMMGKDWLRIVPCVDKMPGVPFLLGATP